ncbi:MAG: hypothetical protein ABW185_29910 [Sedimenticola sp.]
MVKHKHKADKGVGQQNGISSAPTSHVQPPHTAIEHIPTVMAQEAQVSKVIGQAGDVLYGSYVQHGNNTNNTGHHSAGTMNVAPPYPAYPSNQPPFFGGSIVSQSYSDQQAVGPNTIPNTPAYGSLQHITDLLCNVSTRLDNIEQNQNTRLGSIERHIDSIEQQVSHIGSIKQSLLHVESRITIMDSEMSQFKKKVSDYDHSMTCISDICDDVLRTKDVTDRSINSLKSANVGLHEAVIDLQCKSMSDSLLFAGIDEPALQPGAEPEDAKSTLSDFLRCEMGLDTDFEMENVYRRGRFNPRYRYPRGIVGQFRKRSDRDLVRRAAPDKLKDKPRYSIREIFPIEIENKRKQLYPIMKRLKQNKNNRVNLFRDKLYLNGSPYIPSDSEFNQQPVYNRHSSNQNSDAFNTRSGYGNQMQQFPNTVSASYDSSNRWAFPTRSVPPRTAYDFIAQTPIQNRFAPLDNENGGASSAPGKQKARSPLDGDQTYKKQRENSVEFIPPSPIITMPSHVDTANRRFENPTGSATGDSRPDDQTRGNSTATITGLGQESDPETMSSA